jgi:hypothetical protein
MDVAFKFGASPIDAISTNARTARPDQFDIRAFAATSQGSRAGSAIRRR